MTKPARSAVALMILGLAASGAQAGAVEIRHEAVACVAADRYARISASALPKAKVATADLQFREESAAGWYAVRMTLEGERWTAVLPKPVRSLERFEYRIAMTDRDLKVTETAPFRVDVVAGAAACTRGPEYQTAVTSPIVIRVPPGAPLMPPVPGGFSPAGVVAALGPKERGPWKAKWLTVAGIAGGLAAATSARTGTGAVEQDDVVTINVEQVAQNTGRAVSIAHPGEILKIRVSGGLGTPMTLGWRLTGHSPEHGTVCVTTGGQVSLAAAPRPISVYLASPPLEVVPACGNRFAIESGRLTVSRDGQILFDDAVTLLFRIQP